MATKPSERRDCCAAHVFLESAIKKIGLALSGGGFRATLYHLGLLRFLRDAGILQQVTHLTSVSGGSIMAAHLVLNWHRYTGSAEEFDQAAAQLLAFTRMSGEVIREMRDCPVPVIAAVHGMAAGAGAVIALAADFRVCTPAARFAFLFTQVCLSGGDAVPVELQQRFHATFGVQITELWAMTEFGAGSVNPVAGRARPNARPMPS